LSTPTAAPVIAEAWLRGGKTGSGPTSGVGGHANREMRGLTCVNAG
jgi:hypothetical protein